MERVIIESPSFKPAGKKTAVFSILTPFIAVALNFAGVIAITSFSASKIIIAAVAMVVVLAGLISAIIGLTQGIRNNVKFVTGCSIMGLLLNGGIFALAFLFVPAVKGLAGHAGRATLSQLNSMQQVHWNSITVFDPRFGFRFELPPGFVKNPNPPPASQVIHSYVRLASSGAPETVVIITRLYAPMKPQMLKPSPKDLEEFKKGLCVSAPNALLAKTTGEKWKSHKLCVFLTEMPLKGEMISSWSTQVPLAGEAIQVQVVSPQDARDRSRQVLKYILGSLQGNSNLD
jgi:hypothetical protein